ncbi:hypothetical protein KCP69_11605 [Salmonella enterica subsp. enterica]|nr:hypothetical protein KCP69_11605 [Salmonella enterica subsp. enterica]
MGYGALTPVYLANRSQALLGVEQSIRMEIFHASAVCRWRHYIDEQNAIR